MSWKYFLTRPADSLLPSVVESAGDDVLALIAALKALVQKWDEYSDSQVRQFLASDIVHYRFLTGLKLDLEKASAQLHSTCTWRRDYRPECLTLDHVAPFMLPIERPLFYHYGWDLEGHPVLYFHPEAQASLLDDEDGAKKEMLVCTVIEELYRRAFPAEHYRFTLVVDATRLGLTWISQVRRFRELCRSLGDRYCETLHRAYLVNCGWVIRVVWKLVSESMNERTRQKWTVDGKLSSLKDVIDSKMLPDEFGGTSGFRYDFKEHYDEFKARQADAQLQQRVLIEKIRFISEGTVVVVWNDGATSIRLWRCFFGQ